MGFRSMGTRNHSFRDSSYHGIHWVHVWDVLMVWYRCTSPFTPLHHISPHALHAPLGYGVVALGVMQCWCVIGYVVYIIQYIRYPNTSYHFLIPSNTSYTRYHDIWYLGIMGFHGMGTRNTTSHLTSSHHLSSYPLTTT